MKNIPTNLLRAGLIAPLAGPICLFLIVSIAGEISYPSTRPWSYKDYIEFVSYFWLFMVLGAPFGYLVAFIFGVPAYLAMKKIGHINFWTVSIGSMFISLLPTLILSTFFGFNQPSNENNPANLYLAMALSGYIVGVVFWFVSRLGSETGT
jgi:magnesium-transporting ATPase (P-type)